MSRQIRRLGHACPIPPRQAQRGDFLVDEVDVHWNVQEVFADGLRATNSYGTSSRFEFRELREVYRPDQVRTRVQGGVGVLEALRGRHTLRVAVMDTHDPQENALVRNARTTGSFEEHLTLELAPFHRKPLWTLRLSAVPPLLTEPIVLPATRWDETTVCAQGYVQGPEESRVHLVVHVQRPQASSTPELRYWASDASRTHVVVGTSES